MMTPRENVLEVIRWGKPEYIPLSLECFDVVGVFAMPHIEAPLEAGLDAFGVEWVETSEGVMPSNKTFILDDITRWRKVITFPNMEEVKTKIEEAAAFELSEIDREQKAIQLYYDTGLFERIASFMGFEEALVAMTLEPDECKALFAALTEYKLACIEILLDAYKPDILVYFDDVAMARGLFMAPETWRELIKPYHQQLVKAVTGREIIFQQHVCGKVEELLEDYVEMGITMWHTAQVMNDIPAIQEKFKGRLVIEGGWDSSARPGMIDATEDEIRAEVRREVEAYGKRPGFIMSPMMMNEKGNAAVVGDDRFPALFDEWKNCNAL